MEQWVEYITEWSNYKEEDIGVIQGSNNLVYDKNIIIGTIQTLDNNPELCKQLSEEISFIIVDECHCAAASTFQNTLYNFKPHYLLGLSATLERDDDMTFLVKHAIGEAYFVADRDKMVAQELLIKPDFRPILMKRKKIYNENGNKNAINEYYRNTLNEFKEDEQVVKFISELAYHHQKKGDQILMIIKEEKYSEKFYETLLKRLVFTPEQIAVFQKKADEVNEKKRQKIIEKKIKEQETNEKLLAVRSKYKINKSKTNSCVTKHNLKTIEKHTEEIKNTDFEFEKVQWYDLPEAEKASRIAWILGKTSKKRRKLIIEQAKRKEIDIIITTKLFDKALSINSLNVLFNVFPNKELANTYQRIGRVSRTHQGKTYAIVYDFIYMHGIFFNQFYNRNKKCRMLAYQETCILPNYIEEFVKYCQKLFLRKEDDLKSFPLLEQNKNFSIVDLDKLEEDQKCK